MGFDNECILNIQSLAGEYFCPVCRLLVYPNEAFQSQCTHLYCKPCLTYIVGTTRACPYDGYLVTEADSKPLIESNNALAETIGKIAIHCLYHKSGCQWQGSLSECTSHCSECSFGNSPVVCNRCGIQIVHREVQEHAQNCPGVQPQAPQVAGVQAAAAGAPATAAVAAASANAEQTQIANQFGASISQAQTSQTLAGPPTGQDPNQQANVNSQAQAVASAAVPTSEECYQQQYQQYYHQHPGYDPYQQPNQNHYPYQQQAIQQYQQGQHQSQVYSQAQPHSQFQPHVQSQVQPPPQTHQPQIQPPPQTHQPQFQPPPQTHQPQIQPHVQPQPLQFVHAPVAAQASANPQHQLHPTLQPHAQMQSQAQPQPHGHPHPHPHPQPQPQPQPRPQPYALAQPHPQPHPIRSHLQQHMQIPQYQQPQSQMQHLQPQIQPQPYSQVHPQHSLPQLQPPRHLQAQPQAQLQPQPHPRPQLQLPPQLNQPSNPNVQSQTQQPPANAVTGLQSYPQPQAHQQTQLGAQQPPHVHPQGVPIPQQPPQMFPPQSHAPVPKQQQPVVLSSQAQVPSISPAQQQPVHPHAQQPGHPGLLCPVLQPMQQPESQQYLQHQQPFPGQTLAPVHNQLHPHDHFIQQPPPPMQSQLRPQGLPHLEQQNSHDNMLSQLHVAPSHGLQPYQSQNYAARPMMPSHGAHSQPFLQSPVGFVGASQVRPKQLGANQPPANQNYPPRSKHQMQMSSEQQIVQSGLTLKPRVLERHVPEQSVTDRKDGSPSQETALKEQNGLVSTYGLGADTVQVKNLKSETDVKSMDVVQKPMGVDGDNNSEVDTHSKDTDSELHAGGNASAESAVKQMVKKEGNESGWDSLPCGKSVKIVAVGHKDATDLLQRGEHSTADGTSLQQAKSFKKQGGKLQKDVIIDAALLVSGGADEGSQAIPLASANIPGSSAKSQIPLTGRERLQNGSQERNLSQSQSTIQGPRVDEFRSFPSHGQALGKGFMPPAHPFPPTDQIRRQHMPMHYEPSAQQQRSAGAAKSAFPPGPPPNMLRPQGPGCLPQPGQPLNPPDHLEPPVLKQPHGSFHPEIALDGIRGPSSLSLGRAPSHFGPLRNFRLQSVAPQGHYNQVHVPPSHAGLPRMSQGEPPGSFNSLGGMMGRAPLHGPEGHIGQQRPINPMENEVFLDQRSCHLDGRQSDSHLLGSSERSPFGQPPGIESNLMRMNGPPGNDSSFTVGLQDERFNHLTGVGLNHFPMEQHWRVDRGELEDLKQFTRNPHLDTEPAPKFVSYFSSSRPNDRGPHGFSVDAVGPDGNIRRADSTRTHPDFLGPFPGFGRHQMDRSTPRSPGREYHGFSTCDFGGLSGLPHNRSGLDDISGRELRPFGEGSRSFSLRRGEFDGPGNVQSSDLIGEDILPSHLRNEFLGSQNLHGHLLFGEPAGFGAFPGRARTGDLDGPGNFLRLLPRVEPFGGNKSGHPHLGEPGFRSSYSLTGGMDPFDNSRKRKPANMGWCRICKVDCETVGGLDLHSQTRQHQKMAMDMVLNIKQQNAKKQKSQVSQEVTVIRLLFFSGDDILELKFQSQSFQFNNSFFGEGDDITA